MHIFDYVAIGFGYRDGEAEQHWLAVEREILTQLSVAVPSAPAKQVKGRARPKRSQPWRGLPALQPFEQI
jgi:hypothetical protein